MASELTHPLGRVKQLPQVMEVQEARPLPPHCCLLCQNAPYLWVSVRRACSINGWSGGVDKKQHIPVSFQVVKWAELPITLLVWSWCRDQVKLFLPPLPWLASGEGFGCTLSYCINCYLNFFGYKCIFDFWTLLMSSRAISDRIIAYLLHLLIY